MRKLAALPLLAASLLLVACAGGMSLRDYGLPRASVALEATPFFAQDDYQCGPAALATVLNASGVAVTPEALVSQVYLPKRKGSTQAEIIAATRTHGRVPYVLRTELHDLLGEVAAGTPVLVLQNLGFDALPRWHYAVVIGYDTASDSILLRSGTNENLRMSRGKFVAGWARADNWALVTTGPADIPATANLLDWLTAVSAFEELGQPAMAEAAYAAATRRWPQQPLGWQSLANARYAQHDLAGAEAALRQALALAGSAAAHNNLAQLLLERGCHTAARAGIDRADTAVGADVIADVLARTRADIEKSGADDAPGCLP